MVAISYPGVYVEEVSSGVKVIEAAGTSTAAFFGVAEKGPVGIVEKIFGFSEFQEKYGGFLSGSFLAHSVYQFFNNGGRQCYVGRVAIDPESADISLMDQGALDSRTSLVSLTLTASSPGAWGNQILLEVESPGRESQDVNVFTVNVYLENPKGDNILLESFEDLSMLSSSERYVESIINDESRYIRASVNTDNTNNAKGESISTDIVVDRNPVITLLGSGQRQFIINMAGDGEKTVDFGLALDGGGIQVGDDVDNTPDNLLAIATAIQTTIRAISPGHSSNAGYYTAAVVTVEDVPDSSKKKLVIKAGEASEQSSVVITNAGNREFDAAGALGLGIAGEGVEINGSYLKRP